MKPRAAKSASARIPMGLVGALGLAMFAVLALGPITLCRAQDYNRQPKLEPRRVPSAIDGLGSAARFCYPFDVAVDTAGNLYVADNHSHTVRKVTPGGEVTTLAGLPPIRIKAASFGGAIKPQTSTNLTEWKQ